MRFARLALIGCGLMGGSFALALRRAGLVDHIVGHSASERTRQRAVDLGVIDTAAANAAEAAAGADLVLLAVPVGAIPATLQTIAPVLTPRTLLMDVGSTKGDVVAAARATLGSRLPCFVPAHPITGKEVAGIEHAEATLYDGSLTILTPLESCGAQQLSAARALWPALGCRVRELSPEAHDQTFAAVSHLPHLLAFAYVNGVATQARGADYLTLAGPGFRDFSRIAASDPSVWHDILRANQADVLSQLQAFRAALDRLETAMQTTDGAALRELIAQASAIRSSWQLGGVDTDQ